MGENSIFPMVILLWKNIKIKEHVSLLTLYQVGWIWITDNLFHLFIMWALNMWFGKKKKYNNIDENIWQSNVSYMQMLLEFNRAEKIKNASTCNVYLIRRYTVLRNILMDNKWCFISCVYDTKPNHQESKQLQVLGNWLQTWTRFLFPSQV